MLIRPETSQDHNTVFAILESAFETGAEAGLVEKLREKASPIISLVAEAEGGVVGHILFTPVALSDHPEVKMMGLAPMAVSPEYQKQGFGSALVQAGIDACKTAGFAGIIVLGHPEYYPRFGFEPASRFGIDSIYEVPDEVFMAMELSPGSLVGVSGRALYHEAFNDL